MTNRNYEIFRVLFYGTLGLSSPQKKVGKERLGSLRTLAAFQMLLAKLEQKNRQNFVVVVNLQAITQQEKSNSTFWQVCKCPRFITLYHSYFCIFFTAHMHCYFQPLESYRLKPSLILNIPSNFSAGFVLIDWVISANHIANGLSFCDWVVHLG